MASSDAKTVDEYIAGLPDDRREAIEAVREVILRNLPEGYVECMQYGMIGYAIPLSRYPKTYNKQALSIAALASQKNYMSVYLHNVYADEGSARWFTDEYKKTGKRLDMGKSCVRFRRLNDLPLEVIGKAIARTPVDEFIQMYEASRHR